MIWKFVFNIFGGYSNLIVHILYNPFEHILYDPLFLYLQGNNLLTPHWSGFRPNDSCIYQLLSFVHSIYVDFDHNSSLESLCLLFSIKFLFFHQMLGLQKLWKMLFISSKRLFSFLRYSIFRNFCPSFPHFPDSKVQMEVE